MDRFEDVDEHPHFATSSNKKNNGSQGALIDNNFRIILQLCVANGLGRTRLSGRRWRFISIYNKSDEKFHCCNKFLKQATKPTTDSTNLLLAVALSILFVVE
jgi:hypothetical protein